MSHLILLYHIFSGNGFPHIAPRGTANNLQMHKAKHRPTLMPIWQHTDIMVLKTSVKSIRTPDPQKKNLANFRKNFEIFKSVMGLVVEKCWGQKDKNTHGTRLTFRMTNTKHLAESLYRGSVTKCFGIFLFHKSNPSWPLTNRLICFLLKIRFTEIFKF